MASISPPTFPSRSDPNHHKFTFQTPKISSRLKRSSSPSTLHSYHSLSTSHSLSRVSDSSSVCRCHNSSGDSDSPSPSDNSNRRWDSAIQEVLRNAIKRFDDYLSSYRNQSKDWAKKNVEVLEGGDEEEDWDWDRWWKHFSEIDEQERIVSILKAQLGHAVNREDYEDASRLKVAIAAAATNDTVGRVMSHLNSAIKEERYREAAFMRDYAGTGLVGWWAGISDDTNDPYGRIIHISAEHGRYLARSYSPRQLATASAGVPLFEIFLTVNRKGEYKQKAVYLRRMGTPRDFPVVSSKSLGPTGSLNPSDSTEDKTDLFASIEDTGDGEDRDDDFDMVEGLSGFDNILRDMIPGVKVKVLKVTAPEKVDRDLISKVIEQIMEEEDEEKDTEVESVDIENEDKGESDQEHNEIEMDTGGGILDGEERSEIAVKVVVGGLVQKVSNSAPNKNLIRVPARLQKRGRLSFSFSIEKDDKQQVSNGKGQTPRNKKAKLRGQHSMDHVMFDLAKFIGRGKIPMKVLKDVGELIKLTLTQVQNRQLLSGSTTFSRIEIPASPDPLNGLYIGAHGLYSSEVIHLRRKIGQWQEDEDGDTKEPPNLEFYEYVEAVKLTGDLYVPAGQVAFRAKIGKRYQLPHKGIIPEEFGVIARYKGEGRLAEPGFRNPRWVDGELVILDGKYIKGGPVVGFVYWAPEYHFLVFFNRLRLQE